MFCHSAGSGTSVTTSTFLPEVAACVTRVSRTPTHFVSRSGTVRLTEAPGAKANAGNPTRRTWLKAMSTEQSPSRIESAL